MRSVFADLASIPFSDSPRQSRDDGFARESASVANRLKRQERPLALGPANALRPPEIELTPWTPPAAGAPSVPEFADDSIAAEQHERETLPERRGALAGMRLEDFTARHLPKGHKVLAAGYSRSWVVALTQAPPSAWCQFFWATTPRRRLFVNEAPGKWLSYKVDCFKSEIYPDLIERAVLIVPEPPAGSHDSSSANLLWSDSPAYPWSIGGEPALPLVFTRLFAADRL